MLKKERHTFKWDIKKKEYKNGYSDVSQSGFYNKSEWQKVRNIFIFINPLCVSCAKKDIITTADLVDHIRPLTLDDVYSNNHTLLYDDSNLQSLCDKCHSYKTNRDQKINHEKTNNLFLFSNKKQ